MKETQTLLTVKARETYELIEKVAESAQTLYEHGVAIPHNEMIEVRRSEDRMRPGVIYNGTYLTIGRDTTVRILNSLKLSEHEKLCVQLKAVERTMGDKAAHEILRQAEQDRKDVAEAVERIRRGLDQ